MASFATTESELEKQVPRIKPANTWAEPLQFRPTLTGGASRNACTPCRKVKMKCSPGVSSTVCARCQRKGLDCFFEQHRRGRKPGSKIKKKVDSARLSEPSSRPAGSPANETEDASSRIRYVINDQQHAQNQAEVGVVLRGTEPQVSCLGKTAGNSSNAGSPERHEKVDSLSMFSLLNRQAMVGNFSLRNSLSLETNTAPKGKNGAIYHEKQRDPQDPITVGLISHPTALELFDNFMKYLAPYVIHFDPALHTFSYVHGRSSFLLTAILAASAKTFCTTLYASLQDHANNLLGKAFIAGEKSLDLIHAILLMTYWKEPNDTRAWQLVGYACRMCVDLRGQAQKQGLDKRSLNESEVTARERRSLERVWLTLFVYDRSISLQLGRPWMLHVDDLVRTAGTWYKDNLATNWGDAILSAFVELRTIGSEMLEIMSDEDSCNHRQSEISLSMFSSELDLWDKKWDNFFRGLKNINPSQLFLFRFYRSHLRLCINAFRLQIFRGRTENRARQALWLCYNSALQMLQAIIDIAGPAQILYFAQDSIHVMTAYAAVFLIKILLSMPEALPEDAETTILGILRESSDIFSQQCVSVSTSCAFQARFLRTLISQYYNTKEPGTDGGGHALPTAISPSQGYLRGNESNNNKYHHTSGTNYDHAGPPSTFRTTHTGATNTDHNPAIAPTIRHPESYERSGGRDLHPDSMVSGFVDAPMVFSPPTEIEPAGSALWDNIFANAGFTAFDGSLFPSLLDRA